MSHINQLSRYEIQSSSRGGRTYSPQGWKQRRKQKKKNSPKKKSENDKHEDEEGRDKFREIQMPVTKEKYTSLIPVLFSTSPEKKYEKISRAKRRMMETMRLKNFS